MAAGSVPHVLLGRPKGLPSELSSDFSSSGSLAQNQSSPTMASSGQDPWLAIHVKPVDVVDIVLYCTQEIKERGLSVPLLLLPFRPSSDNNATRNLVSQLLTDGRMRGNILKGELGLTSVMVLVGVLKWIWNRIEGGVVGVEAYELFRTGEADSGFPKDAFKTFVPLCVESDAHAQIIEAFFDLLASVAANFKSTGLTPTSVSSFGGWFAFGYDAKEWNFDCGYAAWIKAADACSHLFYAYLRGQDTEESMFRQPALPVTLQKALEDVSYPPMARLNGLPVKKVNFSCERVSPTPFDLLQRLAYTDLPQTQSPASLLYPLDLDNPSGQLSFECERVWKCIVATNESSNFRTPETLYDRNWSKFQDSGFNGLEKSEDLTFRDLTDSRPIPSAVSRLRPNVVRKRPSTPSWGDFLSIGFEDYLQGSPVLLSPEQQLPPINTQPPASSRRFSLTSLDRGRVDDVVNVDLDDAFWYVWIESLSNETPEVKKGVFGRCIVAELDAPRSDWIVVEERVKQEYKELSSVQERSQIAPKKKLFSTKRKKPVIARKELPPLPTDYQQRRAVSEKRAERVQTTAAALHEQRQRTASEPRPVQPDRSMTRTPSNMVFNNLFTIEAQDAFKWTSAYDKHTQRDTYLNGFDPYHSREPSVLQSLPSPSNRYSSRDFSRSQLGSSVGSITPDEFSTPMELPTFDSPFTENSVPRKVINEPSPNRLRFDPRTPPVPHKGNSFSASTPALLPISPYTPPMPKPGQAATAEDSRRASFSSYQPAAPELRHRPRAVSDAHEKPKTTFWGHRKSVSIGSPKSNEKEKPFTKFVNFFKFGRRRRASEGVSRSKHEKTPFEKYEARNREMQMQSSPRKDFSPLNASTASPRSKNSLEQMFQNSPRLDPRKSLPDPPMGEGNSNRYGMIETEVNPVNIRRLDAQNGLAILGNEEGSDASSPIGAFPDDHSQPILHGLAIHPTQGNPLNSKRGSTEGQYAESIVPLFYDAKERNSELVPSPEPFSTPSFQLGKSLEAYSSVSRNGIVDEEGSLRQSNTVDHNAFESQSGVERDDLKEGIESVVSRHYSNENSIKTLQSVSLETPGSRSIRPGQVQRTDVNHQSQYYDTEEPANDPSEGGQEWRDSATSDILQDYGAADGPSQDGHAKDGTDGETDALMHHIANNGHLSAVVTDDTRNEAATTQGEKVDYGPLGRVSNKVEGFAKSIVNGEMDWRGAPMAAWPLNETEEEPAAQYTMETTDVYQDDTAPDDTPRFVEYRIEGRLPLDGLDDSANNTSPVKEETSRMAENHRGEQGETYDNSANKTNPVKEELSRMTETHLGEQGETYDNSANKTSPVKEELSRMTETHLGEQGETYDNSANTTSPVEETSRMTETHPGEQEETLAKMSPETRRTRTLAARDRWAYIRQNASERAKSSKTKGNSPRRVSEEHSMRGSSGSPTSRKVSRDPALEDPDTSDEENVDVKIARIKARVAHLTGMPA